MPDDKCVVLDRHFIPDVIPGVSNVICVLLDVVCVVPHALHVICVVPDVTYCFTYCHVVPDDNHIVPDGNYDVPDDLCGFRCVFSVVICVVPHF